MGKVVCSYCGTMLEGDALKTSIPLSGRTVAAADTEHARTAEDFLPRAPWELGVRDVTNTLSYSCPACAAHIVADQSTVTTSCPYCGNNLLVQGIATPQNIPEQLLLFSVTREEAKERLREHFGGKWYLPGSFAAEVEHVQSVYVPFYLYDLRVWGHGAYILHEGGSDSNTYRAAHLSGYGGFENVAVDGSSKMPDAHMDALSPFDLDGLVPFAAGYAAGHLMEVPDEDAETCGRRAEARVRSTFEAGLNYRVSHVRRGATIEKVVDQETNSRVTNLSTCALPVWLIHCTWEGQQMLFAVNGTNGHCVGNLPVDKVRRAITKGGIIALTIVALILLFVLFGPGALAGDNLKSLLGIACILLMAGVFVAFYVDDQHMEKMNTAKESHSAGINYDEEGLVITESWQAERTRWSTSDALGDL